MSNDFNVGDDVLYDRTLLARIVAIKDDTVTIHVFGDEDDKVRECSRTDLTAYLDSKDKMSKITAYRLPGFYLDCRGAYGIVVSDVYICCFVNSEDGKYDVTVDGIDENGDFAFNRSWESYDSPEEAIWALRQMLKWYVVDRRC